MCGVRITFSISHNGLSASSGSRSKTSRPAPAIRFSLQRRDQRILIDHTAASDIDEVGIQAHRGDLFRAGGAARVCGVAGNVTVT